MVGRSIDIRDFLYIKPYGFQILLGAIFGIMIIDVARGMANLTCFWKRQALREIRRSQMRNREAVREPPRFDCCRRAMTCPHRLYRALLAWALRIGSPLNGWWRFRGTIFEFVIQAVALQQYSTEGTTAAGLLLFLSVLFVQTICISVLQFSYRGQLKFELSAMIDSSSDLFFCCFPVVALFFQFYFPEKALADRNMPQGRFHAIFVQLGTTAMYGAMTSELAVFKLISRCGPLWLSLRTSQAVARYRIKLTQRRYHEASQIRKRQQQKSRAEPISEGPDALKPRGKPRRGLSALYMKRGGILGNIVHSRRDWRGKVDYYMRTEPPADQQSRPVHPWILIVFMGIVTAYFLGGVTMVLLSSQVDCSYGCDTGQCSCPLRTYPIGFQSWRWRFEKCPCFSYMQNCSGIDDGLREIKDYLSYEDHTVATTFIDNCMWFNDSMFRATTRRTELVYLEVNRGSITGLPKDIGRLTSMHSLHLHALSKLTEIGPQVGDVGNSGNALLALTISSPLLSRIPEEIGRLSELRYMEISRSKITELPDTISAMKSLAELRLRHDHLTEVPRPIRGGKLPSLLRLALGGNQITEMDSLGDEMNSAKMWPRLVALELYSNNFTALPDRAILKKMAPILDRGYLNMEGNNITKVPPANQLPDKPERELRDGTKTVRVLRLGSNPFCEKVLAGTASYVAKACDIECQQRLVEACEPSCAPGCIEEDVGLVVDSWHVGLERMTGDGRCHEECNCVECSFDDYDCPQVLRNV